MIRYKIWLSRYLEVMTVVCISDMCVCYDMLASHTTNRSHWGRQSRLKIWKNMLDFGGANQWRWRWAWKSPKGECNVASRHVKSRWNNFSSTFHKSCSIKNDGAWKFIYKWGRGGGRFQVPMLLSWPNSQIFH